MNILKPFYYQCIGKICNILESRGDYKTAIQYLTNYVAKQKSENTPWYYLSILYQRMNDPGKSLGIIDTALRYLPKDTVLNERKTYLVKLLEQRPYEKEINTANEYFNKADYINAIKSLTALINKNANLMSLYEVRGKSSFFIHDYKKSIPDLTIAIQRKPDAGYLYNFRGACYHNLGQDDLACKDFEKGKLLKDKSAEDNYSKFCNKLNNLKLK